MTKINNGKNNTLDPTSANYNEKIKNKSNEKTPFGEDEPSPRTTYK